MRSRPACRARCRTTPERAPPRPFPADSRHPGRRRKALPKSRTQHPPASRRSARQSTQSLRRRTQATRSAGPSRCDTRRHGCHQRPAGAASRGQCLAAREAPPLASYGPKRRRQPPNGHPRSSDGGRPRQQRGLPGESHTPIVRSRHELGRRQRDPAAAGREQGRCRYRVYAGGDLLTLDDDQLVIDRIAGEERDITRVPRAQRSWMLAATNGMERLIGTSGSARARRAAGEPY